MILTSLELINFRNHLRSSFDLDRVCTFFYGKNGVGKSNVLEAIHFLAYAKSYRANELNKLIHHDAKNAEIHALFTDDTKIEHEMSVLIGKKKDLFLTSKR